MGKLSKFYSKYQTQIITNAEANYFITDQLEESYKDVQLTEYTTDLILLEKTGEETKSLVSFILGDRDTEREIVIKLSELALSVGNDTEKLLNLIWEKREELPEFN